MKTSKPVKLADVSDATKAANPGIWQALPQGRANDTETHTKTGNGKKVAKENVLDSLVKNSSGGPNETEKLFRLLHLGAHADVKYEAVTFNFANGHRYTPDFCYFLESGNMCCVEVKGKRKLWSYQRARLAFDQAKVEFPQISFFWAEEQKDGTWRVER